MKPAPFDYVRAESLDEALDVLHREGGEARVLAGGQTLVPMLNMRVAQLRVVVDIMRIPELSRIESAGDTLRVGAAVRQSALERRSDLASRQPMKAQFYEGELWKRELESVLLPMLKKYEVVVVEDPDGMVHW